MTAPPSPAPADAPHSHAPPLASVEWDAAGRVVEWSPEAERLFGWRAAEVRGKRSAEWEFVHPDDRDRVAQAADELARGRARQAFSANRNLARDGRVLHCEWYNTALLDEDGALLAQYSLVLDVTARVEAEQRAARAAARTAQLQAVTAALSEALTPGQVAEAVMAEGVSALGADGAVMTAVSEDGEGLELLAYRGYDPGLMERWGRFPLRLAVPLTEAVRTREVVVIASREERDRRFPDLAGVAHTFPASVSVPFLSEGEPLGAMGLGFHRPPVLEEEDRAFALTLAGQCAQALRRARLYEVERRARAEAEAASRAKSVFLATMSHEIRTPINAVIGYADLLEMGLQGPLAEGQLAYVGRIRASSRHLLGLVNDVLDFARVEAGESAVAPEVVPMAAAVGDAVAMVLPQASTRGVALVEEPCGAGAVVADPDRLRQILLNLLTNAVKFTRPGGRVSVRCLPGGEAGDSAAIEVEDTGIGIAPEHLERIFAPFTQVDESHTRESGGTGLGLAISRRFAELMGGELSVRSRPGTGSVFTLRLPAARTEAEVAERGAEAEAAPPAAAEELLAAGRALEAEAEAVVEAWAARLAADPGAPSARGLPRERLEDHTATFVTELGRSLALRAGGAESDRGDSASIRRTISALHGAQRARIGFTPAELGREYALLMEVVEETVRRAAPQAADAALPLLGRMVDRAAGVAVESHAAVPRGEQLLGRPRDAVERAAAARGVEGAPGEA